MAHTDDENEGVGPGRAGGPPTPGQRGEAEGGDEEIGGGGEVSRVITHQIAGTDGHRGGPSTSVGDEPA